ncbi:MAG: hypothetical protein U1D55_10060 [Phycisphaerae bacterium]
MTDLQRLMISSGYSGEASEAREICLSVRADNGPLSPPRGVANFR